MAAYLQKKRAGREKAKLKTTLLNQKKREEAAGWGNDDGSPGGVDGKKSD